MKKHMFILVFCGILGLALTAWGLYLLFHRPGSSVHPMTAEYADYDQAEVSIRGQVINSALADTMDKRSQGLSDRPSMAMDQGMFFVFPVSWRYSFWMIDMHFPLDMIWIKDGVIVDISKDVPAPAPDTPSSSLPMFTPRSAVNQVLEVNAGISNTYGWEIGDEVQVVIKQK